MCLKYRVILLTKNKSLQPISNARCFVIRILVLTAFSLSLYMYRVNYFLAIFAFYVSSVEVICKLNNLHSPTTFLMICPPKVVKDRRNE